MMYIHINQDDHFNKNRKDKFIIVTPEILAIGHMGISKLIQSA